MRVSFSGAEAEEHRLEAYEGLKSLDGLVRVATIAAHYAATGEVRYRAPYSDLMQTQLSGVRNGSFEFVFDQFSRFADVVEGALARTKAEALFTRLIARGTGQAGEGQLQINGEIIPPGDIDSMAEAAEAAIGSSHRWIDDPVKSIRIIDGEDEITINSETKDYIEQEIIGPEQSQDVSVAALNVNSKTGRVFFFDLGRTVAFSVSREAHARTVANLSQYLNRYANRTGETVAIRYRGVYTVDRRLKKIMISDCYEARDAA